MNRSLRTRWLPLAPAAMALVVGGVAFAVRFALTGAIENDHFVTFARALQVLYGDWPVRDFEDPGFPLSYLLSTAVAAVFGPSLLVNVLLCLVLLAVTSALTYVLAFRATASPAAAIAAATVTIAIYPRLYNATKVVVPIVAIWLAWRYADRAHVHRLFALALWSAVAFLLRHDYLVYVALGNVVLLTVCHARVPREAALHLCAYVALTVLFILPWLLYVQAYEGISQYFASALRFTAVEGRRTASGPFPWLFFAMITIPFAALVASIRRGPYLNGAQLASAAVMLLSLDFVFLRDVLAARIPDVIAPTAVVAAALAAQWLPEQALKRAAAVAAFAVVIAAAAQLTTTSNRIPRPLDAIRRGASIAQHLRRLPPQVIPNPSLAPLIAYLDHCTESGERILVAGFAPEIPVLAHRPFAARLPAWIPGYYEDDANMARALVQLRGEPVGAAVFLDGTSVVARSWPLLLQGIRDRGFDEYAVASINPRLRIWLPQRAAASRDALLDLPCAAH